MLVITEFDRAITFAVSALRMRRHDGSFRVKIGNKIEREPEDFSRHGGENSSGQFQRLSVPETQSRENKFLAKNKRKEGKNSGTRKATEGSGMRLSAELSRTAK